MRGRGVSENGPSGPVWFARARGFANGPTLHTSRARWIQDFNEWEPALALTPGLRSDSEPGRLSRYDFPVYQSTMTLGDGQ